jgi:hypothetical protein
MTNDDISSSELSSLLLYGLGRRGKSGSGMHGLFLAGTLLERKLGHPRRGLGLAVIYRSESGGGPFGT